MSRRPETLLVVLLGVGTLVGCTGRFRNVPLKRYDPTAGYRFDTLKRGNGNTDEVFVVLCFSGGGTRAAAFAYGVLEGLRDTPFGPSNGSGQQRRLLDEVDMISSVSGGSFTAMGYGLWRDRLFDGRFTERFLTRNIQLDLLLHVLNPLNLVRMPLPVIDSIDVAAAYFDERIFERSTYAALLDQGTRPFIIINATDIARQQAFEFTQGNFDLLGSDLSALPVSWAVAASSAYPVLLTPLRLHYYPGEPMLSAIREELTTPDRLYIPRRERWAKSLVKTATDDGRDSIAIDAANHKYMYLLDGGLADNLGLSAIITSYRKGALRRLVDAGKVKRFVVIIVDAGVRRSSDTERNIAAPGRLAAAVTSASTGIYNSSMMASAAVHYALLEAEPKARRGYEECAKILSTHCPNTVAPPPPLSTLMDSYVADVNFHRIEDHTVRGRFMSMVTSLFLPAVEVRDLIEEGRSQIMSHPEIERLIEDTRSEHEN